jgi:cytochrome P450
MTVPIPTTDLALDEIELGDILQWMRPDIDGIFAKLRAEAPIKFFAEPIPPPEIDFPQGPGFWALTRFADVMQVSRDPETFHSAPSINIGDIPPEIAEWLGSMINMDAPKHTKLRLIVNRGFTPRQVAKIDDNVRVQAKELVDNVAKLGGECDFVSEIAAALPLQIICDMLGIPREDNKRIFELTNIILGVGDPEYVQTLEELMGAGMELFQYGINIAQDRLDNPRDDIATTLMHAEVEDENGVHKLTPGELGSFFLLLVVAGNETTRTAISHGMYELTQRPDQRKLWADDLEGVSPTAVEEIVRWSTPVIHFRRTATADTVVGGQEIKAGEKVVMFYNSANRDERMFDDPFRFDLTRTPNEHAGFGAGGPHFCLGANLARREIRIMFEELFRRMPDIAVSGEPDYLQSNFIHGIKRMPCTWHTVLD